MDDTDALQIKIQNARAELPEETRNAIDAVDWKSVIIELRAKKGYTFEQLGDLETETELLLCGLLSPGDYPKELENRLKISKDEASKLTDEMNDLVFRKIQVEMIKNIERKKIFTDKEAAMQLEKTEDLADAENLPKTSTTTNPTPPQNILEKVPAPNMDEEKEEIKVPEKVVPIQLLTQKMSASSLQALPVKREYSPDNLSKTGAEDPIIVKKDLPRVDPYRELPQ